MLLRRRHAGDARGRRARRRAGPGRDRARACSSSPRWRTGWRWSPTAQGEAGAAAARRGGRDRRRDATSCATIPSCCVWARCRAAVAARGRRGPRLIERRVRPRAGAGRRRRAPGAAAHPRPRPGDDRPWPAADASYDEAIRLARETGQRAELGAALAGLAWLEARQGREAALPRARGRGARRCAASSASASTASGRSRRSATSSSALGRARGGDRALRGAGSGCCASSAIADVDLSPAPELVEAYLRLGPRRRRRRGGRRSSPRRAEAKGQPWALARAARCRGLLAEPDDGLDALVRGRRSRFTTRTPDVFETARTQLAYGARLRRARRRVDAREQLRAALETFERLGAGPWADQAERRARGDGRDGTPSRRQHARRPHAAGARRSRVCSRTGRRHARRPPRSSSARRPSSTTCATSTRSSRSTRARSWPNVSSASDHPRAKRVSPSTRRRPAGPRRSPCVRRGRPARSRRRSPPRARPGAR